MWAQLFFRFVTIHAFDRRTDRILIARPRLHSMQRGKNNKQNQEIKQTEFFFLKN